MIDHLDKVAARAAGQRLRQARRARGLAAADVATQLGLSVSAVRNTENGTNGMPLSKATRYAAVVGVSAAWLAFGREDDGPVDIEPSPPPALSQGAALLAVQGLMERAEQARSGEAAQLKELAAWLSKRAFA